MMLQLLCIVLYYNNIQLLGTFLFVTSFKADFTGFKHGILLMYRDDTKDDFSIPRQLLVKPVKQISNSVCFC